MYKFNIEIDDKNIKEGNVAIHFVAKDDEVKCIEIKAAEKMDVLAGIMYLIRTCCYENLEFSKEQLVYALNTVLEDDNNEEEKEKKEVTCEKTIKLNKEESEQFENFIRKLIKKEKGE